MNNSFFKTYLNCMLVFTLLGGILGFLIPPLYADQVSTSGHSYFSDFPLFLIGILFSIINVAAIGATIFITKTKILSEKSLLNSMAKKTIAISLTVLVSIAIAFISIQMAANYSFATVIKHYLPDVVMLAIGMSSVLIASFIACAAIKQTYKKYSELEYDDLSKFGLLFFGITQIINISFFIYSFININSAVSAPDAQVVILAFFCGYFIITILATLSLYAAIVFGKKHGGFCILMLLLLLIVIAPVIFLGYTNVFNNIGRTRYVYYEEDDSEKYDAPTPLNSNYYPTEEDEEAKEQRYLDELRAQREEERERREEEERREKEYFKNAAHFESIWDDNDAKEEVQKALEFYAEVSYDNQIDYIMNIEDYVKYDFDQYSKDDSWPNGKKQFNKVLSYLDKNRKGDLYSIFRTYKSLIPLIISKSEYKKNMQKRVTHLLTAYNDLSMYDDDMTNFEELYETMEQYDHIYYNILIQKVMSYASSYAIPKFIDEDRDGDPYLNEARLLWAYSFWARRYNEGNIEHCISILKQIDAMYNPEEGEEH